MLEIQGELTTYVWSPGPEVPSPSAAVFLRVSSNVSYSSLYRFCVSLVQFILTLEETFNAPVNRKSNLNFWLLVASNLVFCALPERNVSRSFYGSQRIPYTRPLRARRGHFPFLSGSACLFALPPARLGPGGPCRPRCLFLVGQRERQRPLSGGGAGALVCREFQAPVGVGVCASRAL